MMNILMLNVNFHLIHFSYLIFFPFHLAYFEGMPVSRSLRNLQHAMDERQTLSSIDDDERTYTSLSFDEENNKCAIEFLILIFYGGM